MLELCSFSIKLLSKGMAVQSNTPRMYSEGPWFFNVSNARYLPIFPYLWILIMLPYIHYLVILL